MFIWYRNCTSNNKWLNIYQTNIYQFPLQFDLVNESITFNHYTLYVFNISSCVKFHVFFSIHINLNINCKHIINNLHLQTSDLFVHSLVYTCRTVNFFICFAKLRFCNQSIQLHRYHLIKTLIRNKIRVNTYLEFIPLCDDFDFKWLSLSNNRWYFCSLFFSPISTITTIHHNFSFTNTRVKM